jgi:hypothetical protein
LAWWHMMMTISLADFKNHHPPFSRMLKNPPASFSHHSDPPSGPGRLTTRRRAQTWCFLFVAPRARGYKPRAFTRWGLAGWHFCARCVDTLFLFKTWGTVTFWRADNVFHSLLAQEGIDSIETNACIND